jgi:hypothetical protein
MYGQQQSYQGQKDESVLFLVHFTTIAKAEISQFGV